MHYVRCSALSGATRLPLMALLLLQLPLEFTMATLFALLRFADRIQTLRAYTARIPESRCPNLRASESLHERARSRTSRVILAQFSYLPFLRP